jgi:hypothetical protein
MRSRILALLIFLLWMLTSCQKAVPETIITPLDEEFTLSQGQSATLAETALTLTFESVTADERCPSELECAVSGPVTVLLTVQQGDGAATDLILQTFTDNDGHAPDGPFEGIQDRIQIGDYFVRIKDVVPYPVRSFNEIRKAQYQVTLVVGHIVP